MYYPSSVRKNYFFSAQSSIISQKRQQESGSNSHNSSKSVEGKQKKSLNNSFDKIKKDLTKRQEQHYSDFQHIYVTKRLNNQMKPRRNSINSILPTSNITRLKNSIPSIQSKSKQFQNSPSNYFSSKILEKITPPLQQIKLKKMNSENSQISTQIPSITNNFLIEERYGFVRFSQILIETPKPRKDSKSVKRESISILKKKNAFSCSKLDSSYLKLRSTGPPERQKIVDAIQHKYKQILQNLRQKFARRTGKKQFPYLDLIEDEKYNDELFPANNTSIFWTKAKLQQIKINIAEKLNNEEIIQIGWKRLTDIFNPIRQKVILYKENSNQKVIKNEFSVASNDYLMSFNAISNVSLFFKKIFENCQTDYEKHGIYCLKIFQENCWKSIIIDDYIPVIIHKNIKSQEIKIKTLSLDIEVSENCSEIEIWPFLLEKAYASYYNSYESLFQNFNLIDWLQQILMTPSECYYFPDNQQLNEQNVKRLEKILNQFPISQSIIIGFKIKTAQPCIILKKELKNYPQIQDVTIKTIKSQRKMKIRNLFQTFHTFYLFMPFTFKYFNACPWKFYEGIKKDRSATRLKNQNKRINYCSKFFNLRIRIIFNKFTSKIEAILWSEQKKI